MSCLEKIISPSTTTSKIPLLPSMSLALTPKACMSSAARLEARGKYFHLPQYVMEMCIGTILLHDTPV